MAAHEETMTFGNLNESCLFCDPASHGQSSQIILKSDHFYLFAGLGPIVPGYIIIAPYSCGWKNLENRQCIGDLDHALLDELCFLRHLVGTYYRERYHTGGMSFEHGRAGVCNLTDKPDETPHCYHAHLCCYPVSVAIWEGSPASQVQTIDGIFDIRNASKGAPYLYIETFGSSDSQTPGNHESFLSKLIVLGSEDRLESQFLRRRLADALGQPHLWDWRLHPSVNQARDLVIDFRNWLNCQRQCKINATDECPTISFLQSVVRSTQAGYDHAAQQYTSVWGSHIQKKPLGRSLVLLASRADESQRPLQLLDVGCGPGTYVRAFYELGFQCVGIDVSEQMVQIARRNIQALGPLLGGTKPPIPEIYCLSLFDDLPFKPESFDLIWFSAVAVHVPHSFIAPTLSKLRSLLAETGILYFSTQVGRGATARTEGRMFYYHDREELRRQIREAELLILEEWDATSSRGTFGDSRVKAWVHFLLGPAAKANVPGSGTTTEILSRLGEQRIHDHITSLLSPLTGEIYKIGPGDDCAAFAAPHNSWMVVTTDPCPKPVISLLEESDRSLDGWFTMIIGLSDLAAMGAQPIGMLLSLEAPETMSIQELDRFYAGATAASKEFNCPILGGNIKDAATFSCVGTAFGSVEPGNVLRRDTAEAREWVVVLGHMGRFWAGVLHLLEKIDLEEGERDYLLQPLRRPIPRLREGRLLSSEKLSRCAMDSSDGLTACFHGIARASHDIDIIIDLASLTPDPVVAKVAEKAGVDPRKLMLSWGNWELVTTVTQANLGALKSHMTRVNCPMAVVGRTVENGTGKVFAVDGDLYGLLGNFASERFTGSSYFSHGLEKTVLSLRNTPLVSAI